MKEKLILNSKEEIKKHKEKLKILNNKLREINQKLPYHLIVKRENILKQIETEEREVDCIKMLIKDIASKNILCTK